MITEKQITSNLKKIKIKEKYIIIHSDVTGLLFKNFSLKKLWNIIFNSFGKDKTYIFPTLTLKNSRKIWHYSKTKSQSGVLSEFFREKIATRRTIHPIHSVSIFGKDEFKVPDHKSTSSFGRGSTWEWICNSKDVCNIGLGLNLHGGGTFCHYAEEKSKVNYRRYKKIKVKVTDNQNNLVRRNFTYFSRNSKFKDLINDWKICEKDLIKKKLLKKFIFKENGFNVTKMNTYNVTKFIMKKIKYNTYYLTNKNLPH